MLTVIAWTPVPVMKIQYTGYPNFTHLVAPEDPVQVTSAKEIGRLTSHVIAAALIAVVD